MVSVPRGVPLATGASTASASETDCSRVPALLFSSSSALPSSSTGCTVAWVPRRTVTGGSASWGVTCSRL